ncbi:hypothetical protein [Catenuloplanes indicus]|uniref:Uncharacterized protein n=1 Tax=Catenuloplanes indicus TaxID=137267 RepID=A0AAE3VWV5_9ACTN|nr:hypothetical protein [Catenuloplanes indicus]MDQ0364762.1 hypothetical protein [Catenuloplanes indicus]
MRFLRRLAATAALAPLPAVTADPAAAVPRDSGDWPAWQGDLRGSRHNPDERRITPATAGKLRLKWAFA